MSIMPIPEKRAALVWKSESCNSFTCLYAPCAAFCVFRPASVWFSQESSCRIRCRASRGVSRPPEDRSNEWRRLKLGLNADLLVVVLSIERALLLALLTSNWGSVLFLRIGTPLAFVVDETGYDVAVLARTGFAVQFDVLLTLFTNCRRAAFPEIKKFQSPQYFLIAKYQWGTASIEVNINWIGWETLEGRKVKFTYVLCWNSDRQKVHFTIGKEPRHSCNTIENFH